MWGRALCLALCLGVGCGDNRGPGAPVDAAPDTPDVPPENPFFGEPCELATYPGAVRGCHCLEYYSNGDCRQNAGWCVDEAGDGRGVCRPFCDQLSPDVNPIYTCNGPRAGGLVTWTSDGSVEPYVCYCRPPG